MALTLEDGTVVSGADSYISRNDFIAYAIKRGVTIADTDASDVLLVKAFDFIGTLEGKLKGFRRYESYANAYPRNDLEINGYYIGNSTVPQIVKDLQCELALDLNSGVDLYNRKQSDSAPVKKVRVEGAVEKEYAVRNQAAPLRRSLSTRLIGQISHSYGPSMPVLLA